MPAWTRSASACSGTCKPCFPPSSLPMRRISLRGLPRARAPGVYVAGDKIAALGLRVRNGCSYHGLAINVDADLAPFGWINPCGYEGLKTIRMKDFGIDTSVEAVGECLLGHLQRLLPPRRPTPAPDIGETDNANPPAEPAAAVRAGS